MQEHMGGRAAGDAITWGDLEEQTEKHVGGTYRLGFQNHWTNIKPNYL